MISEVGWLVEADGECIGMVAGEIAWVPYTYDNALRFARKSDAEAMLEYLKLSGVTIVPPGTFIGEHLWSDGYDA